MGTEFVDAVKRGDLGTVERMLQRDRSHLGAADEHGTSPLLLAYYHGHPEVAAALLAHKPELSIYEASAVGDAARIREIATPQRALIDTYASDGFTALGLAAFFKRPEAVRALLELGADPHLASRPAGFTPLHSAVADDTGGAGKEIARMLLRAGADPNAQSASGNTPLHTVAFTGDVEITKLLLASGGDATIKNNDGLTPLDVARDRGRAEVAALLHDAVIGKSS
jgi:ankyrin repeat protein